MLKDKDEIVNNARGLWLSALFSNVCGYNPELSFVQQREAFFGLVAELLEAKIIRFASPNEIWSEQNDIWQAPTETILNYLRERWPPHAESENQLTEYFFAVPAVLWVGEDGIFRGS